MTVMVLAAGRGERLRPLTDELPKALVEVAGISLLERHLERLGKAGVNTVVINLGWLGEHIVRRIGSGSRFGLQVVYSPEYDNVLETGGGVHRALPLLGTAQPFWVINADIVCDFDVTATVLPDNATAHLILVPNPAYRDNGDFALVDGRVTNDREAPLTFSGIALYRAEFFDGCKAGRFSVVPLLRRAADDGRVSGEIHHGVWADVGTQERLAEADRLLQDGRSPAT
ncbi:MAG: nucleotidyltransferase family protein [Woeseia sp.]